MAEYTGTLNIRLSTLDTGHSCPRALDPIYYIVIYYIYIYNQGMKQYAQENVVYVYKTCQIEITNLPLLFFFLVNKT